MEMRTSSWIFVEPVAGTVAEAQLPRRAWEVGKDDDEGWMCPKDRMLGSATARGVNGRVDGHMCVEGFVPKLLLGFQHAAPFNALHLLSTFAATTTHEQYARAGLPRMNDSLVHPKKERRSAFLILTGASARTGVTSEGHFG